MSALTVTAPAKVNLTLRVTGRRDDGYHLLDTVMVSVDVADTLQMRAAPGLMLRVEGDAPADESNLVLRAARLLEPLAGGRGAELCLRKSIPSLAGLGGGSADAAAALAGLNRLWALKLSPEAMRAMALRLGADVPFMLTGGLARCRGVGEDVTPLPFRRSFPLLLIKGTGGISTADAYKALDAVKPPAAPASAGETVAALDGGDATALAATLRNDLEAPAAALGLPVERTLEDLLRQGALAARMTGSGGAFFGLFADREAAEKAGRVLAERYPFCRAAGTLPHGLRITGEP